MWSGIQFQVWIVIPLMTIGMTYVFAIEKTCTDLSKLPLSSVNSRLDEAVFITVVADGVVSCAKECMTRSVCQSFNFHLDNGSCEMNTVSGPDWTSGVQMIPANRYVFSKSDDWQRISLGVCENHGCPDNARCSETVDGSKDCIITHCIDPPLVPDSYLTTDWGQMTAVGQSLPLECHTGYVPCGNVTCHPDGSWTSMTCKPVSSCADVKVLNADYTDGEYWLYPKDFGNVRVRVYCHGMNSTPGEFISLKTPYFMDAPRLQNLDCNGETDCSDELLGYHIYTKFGLDIETVSIKKRGRTFYTHGGVKNANVGMVRDCYSGSNSTCGPLGHLVMDLRETGLGVHDSVQWKISHGNNTWEPQVNRSHSGQLIEVWCGGTCGICAAQGKMLLQYVQNDFIPKDGATSPRCEIASP